MELQELRALAKPVEAGNMESMLHHKIFRDTMYHPTIVPIIKELCGDNFRLDHLNIHTHVAAGFKGGFYIKCVYGWWLTRSGRGLYCLLK